MTQPAWHAGERAVQERAGVAARMADVGPRVLRDHMPQQHREFFAELPFLLAGTLAEDGQPWAGVLAGPPGFVQAPDPYRLRVAATPLTGDPTRLAEGAPIGLLGIQPHTRRRNRMNGYVTSLGADAFDIVVGQSFGNCPKYITPREVTWAPVRGTPMMQGDGLGAQARALVAAADVFFIATAHPDAATAATPAAGIDVSHRGGPPGFVQWKDERTLLVPDYVGNTFFNTLGNLQLNPRAGLLFLDAARNERLYLAATADLVWSGPEVAHFPGAQRLLRLTIGDARHVSGGLPLTWSDMAQL